MKNVNCAYWSEGDKCLKYSEPEYQDFCVLGPCPSLKPSHGDQLRAMTDEELAKTISENILCESCERMNDGYRPCLGGEICEEHWLKWLKQEVDK